MSFQLCDRIFRHLESMELLKQGDTILDFMAGTFRTGVIAELHRYPAIGVELEQHFVDMIEKNKKVLKQQTQRDPSWTIVKGDSRHLSELLNQNGLTSLVSPPYGDVDLNLRKNGIIEEERGGKYTRPNMAEGYSSDPENIGNLPDKGLVSLTSPPYAQAQDGGGIFKKGYGDGSDKVGERTYADSTHNYSREQIGSLQDKVAVTSPPYESAINDKREEAHSVGSTSIKNGINDSSVGSYGKAPSKSGLQKERRI